MPKRTDIKKILLIGSGPIVIGQACEFDYSGTQACKALREEGYDGRVRQLQSGHDHDRPRDLPTRPTSSRSRWEIVEKVIEKERPDALLATLGGQTALNIAMALDKHGVLEELRRRDDRCQARRNRQGRGPPEVQGRDAQDRPRDVPRSSLVATRWPRPTRSADDRLARASCGRASRWAAPAAASPTTARSSTTIVRPPRLFSTLSASPTTEVLIEESIIGWKEYELEVMRDHADNVVIICSIENLDPMGVHTGRQRSPSPRRRRSPTKNTSGCATPREGSSSARSASRPAGRTSSSPSDPARRGG